MVAPRTTTRCNGMGGVVGVLESPPGGPCHHVARREASRDPTEDFDMVDTATRTPALPKPDTRLREFERFIGTWEMKGRTLDSDHDNVNARATFEYLPGGFFVAQRFKADFDGMPIESLEIIGYDPRPAPSPRPSTRTWPRSRWPTSGSSTGTM